MHATMVSSTPCEHPNLAFHADCECVLVSTVQPLLQSQVLQVLSLLVSLATKFRKGVN